jgi:hypothetical protein
MGRAGESGKLPFAPWADREGLEILGPAETGDADENAGAGDDPVRVAVLTGPEMRTESYTAYVTGLKQTALGLTPEPESDT